MDGPRVVVVGGGGTGGALAHDLALRGVAVTLLERGELTSETTGRHHGLLHSGARYAVSDPESAVECIAENRLARPPRAPPGHLGVRGQPAHRVGLVAYLYLHLAILSTLLCGPGAWDGLVALFRNPVFLALDVLLVAGLAFHGFNGLRVALVGSGLLADRHKALLVAASLLVGLVSLVAAVRIVLA